MALIPAAALSAVVTSHSRRSVPRNAHKMLESSSTHSTRGLAEFEISESISMLSEPYCTILGIYYPQFQRGKRR